MPELTTAESNEDLGFPSASQPENTPNGDPERPKGPRLTRLKVNLSTPLIVKTAGGENQAGPGDVVGHFGKHDVMMSKDLYIALLGQNKYDELVRKEMLKIRIAKRLDDGQPAFTEEQLGQQRKEIDEALKNRPKPVAVDPNDLHARVQVTDSKNGPPTTKPDEYATIVPGPMLPIPEDTEDETEPPPTVGADGATAGQPGTFTPENSTVPANIGQMVGLAATPDTLWNPNEYVVLGDGSECYWSGGAWVVGRAPVTGIDDPAAHEVNDKVKANQKNYDSPNTTSSVPNDPFANLR